MSLSAARYDAAIKGAPQGFTKQCDHCEKFFFRADIRPVTLRSKSGEVATFEICRTCRGTLRERIAADAGKVFGITADVYQIIEKLFRSTELLATSSKGRKAHTISIDDVIGVWKSQDGKCALTGATLNPTGDGMDLPSIDRIDSRTGYIAGNIQIVCQSINYMKGALNQADFIALCQSVARHTLH